MIGTELESHPTTPFIAAFLFALALGCELVAVLLKSRDWMLAGLLPLAVSVVFLFARERRFVAKLTEQGIVIMPEGQLVRYDSIRTIWPTVQTERVRSNGQTYAFNVQHDNQVLSVPAHLNVASQDVVQFLTTRIRQVQSVPANSAVADYMQRQVSTFGADHVWSFAARTRAAIGSRRPYLKCLVMLAVSAVGLVWLIVGSNWHTDGWTAVGGILLFVGLFGALLLFAVAKGSAPRFKNWQSSSLVISPIGFALSQGELCGELRWKEIREVRLQRASQGVFSDISARGRGVLVRVEGANILIADLYDAPIEVIHDRIAQLWRHGD